MELTDQPTKKSRLTLYIVIAMVVGILFGYYLNKQAAGDKITYSPAKDFTGKDSLAITLSGTTYFQKIIVVKDSAAYKKMKDSVALDNWLVVANTSKHYVPAKLSIDKKIDMISMPQHGTTSIKALDEISDILKLFTTIFLRLVQMIIAPIV